MYPVMGNCIIAHPDLPLTLVTWLLLSLRSSAWAVVRQAYDR